ncbi:GFA family protein [Pelagibius sp. Alg239-R121]|uniref:GFA family protein n=1 Tax=Pelagibius sp. Alg239-R121 TaxID=2993448 RepID=UPI0024A75450|nr:GFA family protein [Pelagibius sp. Alg239-R121]
MRLDLAFPARIKRRNAPVMTDDVTVTRGSCLCGAVAFEIDGPLQPVVNCHCGQCRKMTGHYLAATDVSHDHFRFTNDDELKWYHASDIARRGFCGACGSTLFWEQHGSGRIAIAAGCLENAEGLTTAAHIFVADKGDYYELADGLPQYARSDMTDEAEK